MNYKRILPKILLVKKLRDTNSQSYVSRAKISELAKFDGGGADDTAVAITSI